VRTALLQVCALTAVLGVGGCAPEEPANPDNTGGSPGVSGGTGPTQQGGTGPAASGGRTGSGGITGSGGMAPGTGGASPSTGGKATGGTATGGTATGGKATGGTATGGTATGGKATGGTATGGKATGGSATGGGTAVNCSGTPLTGGTQICSSYQEGNAGNGYTYTIWSSGSGGCITPHGVGATFKATWNNSGDFLARVGLKLGSNKTYNQYGTFSADFAETHTGTAGGYSYIGIYGWSVGSAIHEYYIIDDWFGSRPNPGTKKGSITIDGEGTYDILTHMMTGPMITGGSGTFEQFWSLRTTARSCGHISITKHFDAWKALGMILTNMEEAKILVEAGGGVGSIDFTTATITAQ
jgi:endo-1,4-beta-xylanase